MAVDIGKEDQWAHSEFGGQVQKNGLQPWHEPTASEKLSLIYRTGNDINDPVDWPVDEEGVIMTGLLPAAEQFALNEAAGLYEKGQYDPRKKA